MQLEDLYFAPEDLYRLGNSTSPRLTNVRRPKDIDTTLINGITVVIANGKGVSLSTKERLEKTPMSGWVWKIAKGSQIPTGLKLLNDRPGHYGICPISNMPLDEFIGLLSKLALKCSKVFKKEVI
ncbi:Tse2 family ADP-ribosyltransferase toxin [Sessilibacter sp. MAH4]